MRRRRQSREHAALLRLFGAGFVLIRAAAHAGDAETARRLADAFHNAPTSLIAGDPQVILADIRDRCERHGLMEHYDYMARVAGVNEARGSRRAAARR